MPRELLELQRSVFAISPMQSAHSGSQALIGFQQRVV